MSQQSCDVECVNTPADTPRLSCILGNPHFHSAFKVAKHKLPSGEEVCQDSNKWRSQILLKRTIGMAMLMI